VSYGASNPLRIADATGDTLIFDVPPVRLLSLVPSATRAIQELGVGHLLVGRTEYDTDPSLEALPSVGRGLEPNLEALALLDPDLVIRFAGESDPSTPGRLNDLGIPHFAIRLDKIADVEAMFSDLGTIFGVEHAATAAVDEIRAAQARIREAVRGEEVVRVAYVLGGDPPWVAGSGTFIDELLHLGGGSNVFADLEDLYGPVSIETFLVREIDLVIAPEGAELKLPDGEFSVVRVSPDLELPGPDLAQSALEVASILHPESFR
jgi:iron complex transport system substrate-binding protein